MNQMNYYMNFIKKRETGRCGNVFNHGPVLYSYGFHYKMAEYFQQYRLLVINATKSTVTTQKQKGVLHRAAMGMGISIAELPDCDINKVDSQYENFLKESIGFIKGGRSITRMRFVFNQIYEQCGHYEVLCDILGREVTITKDKISEMLKEDPRVASKIVKMRMG